MSVETSLVSLFIAELAKLSLEEVSNFCGEVYFQESKKRLQRNEGLQLISHTSPSSHAFVQLLTFQHNQNDVIEVALLRSQWEIYSTCDRLTYHFFRKEFTAALFARPSESLPSGRQLLSDTFVSLWLLSQSPSLQKEWKFKADWTETLALTSLSAPSQESALSSESSISDPIEALLVCMPNVASGNTLEPDLMVPPTLQAPALFQGQLFKILNPTILKARAVSLDANKLGAQVEKAGLAELQIQMKDGRIIPLRTNEELIEYLGNHRSENIDRRTLDKLCKISEEDSLVLRSYERNKFNLIDKFFFENKKVYVVLGYSATSERPAYLCRNFAALPFGGIYQKPEIQLQSRDGFGALDVQLSLPAPFADSIFTNQLSLNCANRTLTFHDFHQISRKFLQFMGEKNIEAGIQDWGAQAPTFTLVGHQKIYLFLRNLFETLGKEVQIKRFNEIHCQGALSSRIAVDKESFRIFHQWQENGKTLTAGNFSPQWREILRGCEGGLHATFLGKNIESSYSVRRSQRVNEAKFLKHPGIFMMILHSILDWKFQQENLGQTKSLFYEQLWERLALLFSTRTEGQPAETIDDVLSVKIKKLALDFIENLIDFLDEDHSTPLLGNNEIYLVRGLPHQEAKLIYYWLHTVANFTKGDLFAKSTPRYFPSGWFSSSSLGEASAPLEQYLITDKVEDLKIPDFRSYPTRNQESLYQIPLSSWARLPHTFESYDVRLDNRPLEQLTEDSFKVSFEVTQAQANEEEAGRIDWFDLNPRYFLNGKEITERDAQKLTFDGVLEYQGRFYVLDQQKFPNHKALEIFWHRLQFNNQKTVRTNKKVEEDVSSQRHHILELLALRRMGIPFKGPKEWEDICDYYDRLSQPRNQLDLGESLQNTLKPYQLAGVQWLWDLFQLRIGGILADDMGLGKTAQALSFLNFGFEKKAIKRVLIVVPVSLTFNWMAESQKFTPNLKVSVFDPKAPETLNTDVVVCTYSLLSIHHKLFEKEVFDVVIFDEAQYLKNIGTNRFKSSEFLKAKFKVALTGTPIENNLNELYALFHLVAPGLLGQRLDFQRLYVKATEHLEQNIQFLKARLKPLILRRRKQDLALELPEKTENQIFVEFSKKQKELYRNTALSWSQKVNEAINQKGASQSKLYMLTALLRLRQVCSDPAALPSVVYKEIPPKISILIDMLEEITSEGHSAIVFTQFMSTFARLRDLLKKHNIKSFEMHGGTPRKDRETLLREFSSENDEKGSVLLMTLKTGGVGLNLTRASYVFHLEPWWNPAVENQATDRVHRLGQRKSVTVYRLIMKESVEEKVEVLKSRKAQLFNSLFGDDYFSLESAEVNSSEEGTNQVTITKEDFDALIQ